MSSLICLLLLSLLVQVSLFAANFPHFSTTTPLPAPIFSSAIQGKNLEVKDADAIDAAAKSLNSGGNISKMLIGDDSDENVADYADMISIEDELSIEDEALALAHVEMDINDFEDLKKTIAYLEEHISKHADVNVVDSKELVEADKMLKDLDVKVIKPYEQELLSLKSQIGKLNHKFDNESISQISAIVENAEMFLQTSKERLEQFNLLEQDWEAAEESAKIQESLNDNSGGNTSKMLIGDHADENIADYADMIPIEDELSLEDEALALAHVEMDINDFEDLKKTIAYLEEHISKHADVNVVKSKELVEADKMLKDLELKVIKPYEQELLSLKSQIGKLNHKFDNESISQINAIVENAEMFLQTSKERLDQFELQEQDWEVAEESAKIQEMIDLDERRQFNGKIIIEALKPAVSDKLKKKLGGNIQDDEPSKTYPTSMSGSLPKLEFDKSLTEAKSMYNKMKQMKMLRNVEKQTGRPTNYNSNELDEDSNDGDDKRTVDLQKIAEMAKIAALRQVKENLEREVFSDLKGKDMFSNPVEHYSIGVQEALETSKEISHEFIHEKMHHQEVV